MITIHLNFSTGDEVSLFRGRKLKDNFKTHCIEFFNQDSEVEVMLLNSKGDYLLLSDIFKQGVHKLGKEIRKEHKLYKMVLNNDLNLLSGNIHNENIQKDDSVVTHEVVLLDMGEDELIPIDVDLAPLIKELNEDGYKTYFCCSGHLDTNENGGYIMFEYCKRNREWLLAILNTIDVTEPKYNNDYLVYIDIRNYQNKKRIDIDKSLCLRWTIKTKAGYERIKKMFQDGIDLIQSGVLDNEVNVI